MNLAFNLFDEKLPRYGPSFERDKHAQNVNGAGLILLVHNGYARLSLLKLGPYLALLEIRHVTQLTQRVRTTVVLLYRQCILHSN